MTTFVLVHGGWHGGWCWKKLTPLLRAAEHQVFTPTLTGLGERSHLLTSEVDLATHVKDIALVLEYEDLQHVVLVGHSYGGMVITGVAEAVGSRVAQLVYLDAFLPENGKSLIDYAALPPTREGGWRVPPPATMRDFGVTDETDIAWAEARLGDQPARTFTQPVQLSARTYELLPKTFIQLSEAPWFVEAAERAKQQGFRYYRLLSGGHDAMLSQPNELSQILLELVGM
jgi:pimeloyl-ACP methyl ester carboxylesterase